LIFPWLERDESKYKNYYTLVFGTTEEFEELLKKGQDPNKIKHPPWESSWDHRNPLWMAAGNYDKANLLIKYGADATRRPYIARIMDRKIISDRFPDEMLVKGLGDSRQAINVIYEDYLYEKVKLFLEAGADPNMKGNGVSARLFLQTERNYLRWYNEYGILPINFAIEDNAFSIVELLLNYGALLDQESLKRARKATEKSGYTEMEDYIKEVWIKQQNEK
jgi:ankyrin repeat protein